jgi:hypothetical protein
MAANAEFSTTLDYEFFGGGTVFVVGGGSVSIDYTLDSDVKALIFAESSNNFIDFTFSGGIQLPTINASANLSFGFSVSATVEFGIQSFAVANTRIEFSSTSEGFALIKGSVDYVLPFVAQSTITQFSLAFANISFDFSVDSEVLNYSLQIVDRLGQNDIEFISYEFNEAHVLNENNFVEIIESGYNEAKILSR